MKQDYTFTIYTDNQVGILMRIAIMFSRRKINIESLNVSPSELDGIHRFTIVIHETTDVTKKIVRQINNQVGILKAFINTNDELVWQEIALYKVVASAVFEKVFVERLLRQHGARAVVIRKDYIVFETTGHREETEGLIKALEPIGLIEFVRSGRIAIIKSSKGFHEQMIEFEENHKAEILHENRFLDQSDTVFSM